MAWKMCWLAPPLVLNEGMKMFRPHIRNKEAEQAFLSGPDLSICPICGYSEHLWHGWGKGKDADLVTSVICTHCGWVCGDSNFLHVIKCKFIEFFHCLEHISNKTR